MQQTMQTPSAEDTLLFRSFKLLQDFPTRKQLYSPSLLSHRNRVFMGTSPYTVRYRQGHAGGGYRAGPASRLLYHKELLRLSCGPGIWAGHTGWRPRSMYNGLLIRVSAQISLGPNCSPPQCHRSMRFWLLVNDSRVTLFLQMFGSKSMFINAERNKLRSRCFPTTFKYLH